MMRDYAPGDFVAFVRSKDRVLTERFVHESRMSHFRARFQEDVTSSSKVAFILTENSRIGGPEVIRRIFLRNRNRTPAEAGVSSAAKAGLQIERGSLILVLHGMSTGLGTAGSFFPLINLCGRRREPSRVCDWMLERPTGLHSIADRSDSPFRLSSFSQNRLSTGVKKREIIPGDTSPHL